MSTTPLPKIIRWTVFSRAITSWPTTLSLTLLELARPAPTAPTISLAHR